MSRNLGDISCKFCWARVVLEEAPRPITEQERGCLEQYDGLVVANAHCFECNAKYLAWVDGTRIIGNWPKPEAGYEFGDLSFRSSFNDEPGHEDMPDYVVERRVVYDRKGPWPVCPVCGRKYVWSSEPRCMEEH